MKRFYSQQTGCTYIAGVNDHVMPDDAKEISEERYMAVIANPVPGKIRGHDKDGLPILIDKPTSTADQHQEIINAKARAYLAGTDWYVIRWQEKGTPIPEEISAERDAARARVVEVR